MIQHLSFTFIPFFAFATQLFSTPVTSLNLHNQAPLFTLQSSAFYRQPIIASSRHIYVLLFFAHDPVRGESHNQHATTPERLQHYQAFGHRHLGGKVDTA